jgi:FtsP/CotA-like multicopper oxidase with cupredoxin domain
VSGTKITPTSSICTSVSGTFTTTIATTTVSTYSYTLTQGPLLPQASCTVILTVTGLTITPGVAYSVRIATSNGGVFAYTCVAGQRTGSY